MMVNPQPEEDTMAVRDISDTPEARRLIEALNDGLGSDAANECNECGRPVGKSPMGSSPDYCPGHQYLSTSAGQTFRDLLERMAEDRDGKARQCQWQAEDGWLIVYTTTRVEGGPHHGKFLTLAYKPEGKGARSGRGQATGWVQVYSRPFSTRKAAKKRATDLYYRHSPKTAARHGLGHA